MYKFSILSDKIEEILTSSYPFKKEKSSAHSASHDYTFKTEKGNDYKVSIHHRYNDDDDHETAQISFKDHHGKQALNNQEHHTAHKVLGTVKSIVKHHLDTHSNVNRVGFSAANEEPSRVNLYRKIVKHITKKHKEFEDEDDQHGFIADKKDIK